MRAGAVGGGGGCIGLAVGIVRVVGRGVAGGS